MQKFLSGPTTNQLYMGNIFVKVAVAPPPCSPFKEINIPQEIRALYNYAPLYFLFSLTFGPISITKSNCERQNSKNTLP